MIWMRLAIAFADRRLDPDPAGFLRLGIVGAMRLFGVAFFGQFQIAHGPAGSAPSGRWFNPK
jgi:hypothetical protein